MTPARGTVLLRKVETEETFGGGLIVIPQASREKTAANQMWVVAVGEPEECRWPQDCDLPNHKFISLRECVHPYDPRIKEGAWVVVRPRSLVDAGEETYVIRQSEVLAVFSLTTDVPSPIVAAERTEEIPLLAD